jgi:tetratricopeptide (TPR) repeat protein
MVYDARGWYQGTIELATDLLDILSSAPSTPERSMREVTLRTSLARALLAMHGYTKEVEEAYDRALELFEGQRDLPQLFPVLRGLASFFLYRGEMAKCANVGAEILRLADAQNEPSMRVDGHLLLGVGLSFSEEARTGLEHLDKAIAWLSSARSPSRRYRLGNDSGVACFTTSALVLWMLGYPDRAVQRADDAMRRAIDLDHPSTRAYALFHTGLLHHWMRAHEIARDRAIAVLEIADDHDLPIWSALGGCLLGASTAALGDPEAGLARFGEGIDLYQGMQTPPVFWPLLQYVRADVCLRAGRREDALALIEEAIEIVGTGDPFLVPEFYIVKGDVLLALSGESGAAEPWFRDAHDVAVRVDARMPRLRAAIRLCQTRREEVGLAEARRLLAAAYDTFTEGHSTADLVDARALLSGASP